MASERHAGMPLLLLAEQTVDGAILKKSSETTSTPLAKLETKDKRVSFVPVIERKIEKDAGSACECLSLDLFCSCSHTDKNSLMMQCKMTVEGYGLKSTKITIHTIEEESFVLKGTGHNAGVVSLRTNSLHNKKVTVLFMLYSIAAPHPATGAGLHLNRARSEGTLCDVKLLVDGVELPAHRAVLAVRSPVLDRMLTGDFKEAREGRVELVDTSAAAVEKFLEFLYTDRIEVWHDSELDLLHLAEKYMVPELRTECCLRLWSCEPPRALSLLNATAAATGTTISSALRQRLTTIVANNLQTLTSTKEWADFKAAYPVVVDTMLGASRAQTQSSTLSVWE